VIRSPIDGTVVARNVDVGQTVAASLQAPTIFTIAQDLTKMWVYAKTDESDVDNIQVGKVVTFKVDALPKQTFRGVVSQVRCLRDHPGGHGTKCIKAAEHGLTVQAADGH
jgi:HlyD family secretion protein